jgi:hypothetical protein
MSIAPKTKEPQYGLIFDVIEKHGVSQLGLMTNESWNQDPKRTLFTLARYKFVAKMLFSMNDEVVHTRFYPMAHYPTALCCGKKAGAVQ